MLCEDNNNSVFSTLYQPSINDIGCSIPCLRAFFGGGGGMYADNTITWTAPALDAGSGLDLEFVLDFCGYCEKYSDVQKFNPIDSFHYRWVGCVCLSASERAAIFTDGVSFF